MQYNVETAINLRGKGSVYIHVSYAMRFCDIFLAAHLSDIPDVLGETVYLTDPRHPNDVFEEDLGVLEKNRASGIPMRQSLRAILRLEELNQKNLETPLSEKDEYVNFLEAKHAQELQDKEIETKRVIENLQGQLDEARGQLYGGQPQNFSNIPKPHNLDKSDNCKLANLSMTDDYFGGCYSDVLCEATAMSSNKNYQGALIHLDTNISATDPTTLHANATLIKSAILRLCDNPKRGLEHAERVVYIANLNNLRTLLAKAQLYRGLCLYDLGLYADALRCYIRAASIRWFAKDVPRLTAMAEKRRDALPRGNRGKHLSPDFQEIPLSTSAKGFGSS